MATRLTPEGFLDPCGSCMSTEAAMIYRGTPWCSDDCRKQMLATLEDLKDVAERRLATEIAAGRCVCEELGIGKPRWTKMCPVHGESGALNVTITEDLGSRPPLPPPYAERDSIRRRGW